MSIFRSRALRPIASLSKNWVGPLLAVIGLLCSSGPASAMNFPFRCGGGPWTDLVECRNHYDFVTFWTRIGEVRLIVPNDRPAGETVSSRAFFYPKGNDPATRIKNMEQLRAAYLKLPGMRQRVSLAEKSFAWKVIGHEGSICFEPESLLEQPEKSCHEIGGQGWANLHLGPITSDADQIQAPDLQLISMPLRVSGYFSGDLGSTFATLNDESAVILAESPGEILVASPEHVGDAVLVVEDAKRRRVGKYVRFYDLTFCPEMIPMRKGPNRVQLTVSGLSNLEAVKLELADGDPLLGVGGSVDRADGAVLNAVQDGR